jgi:hypothetical protein
MSKGLVLISGINGYIAAVTAKQFLDHGFSVRGTVRKQGSAERLIKGPLKDYANAGKLEIVEVPDITVDGAFDEAVKGTYPVKSKAATETRSQRHLTLHRRNHHRPPRLPRFPQLQRPRANHPHSRQRHTDHTRQRPCTRRPTAQVHRSHVLPRSDVKFSSSPLHTHRK